MIYDSADKAIREMNRRNLKAFNRLKLAKWDELSIIKEVGKTYDDSVKFAKTKYKEIAVEAYTVSLYKMKWEPKKATKQADEDITNDWVLDMLEESDPVTLYAFLPEAERKKQRLIEALAATESKNAEIDRALRYWTQQVGQYALNTVFRARLDAFRVAGVKRVRWMTADDERVCEECGPRHGQIFDIDSVPPPPHRNCRCWLESAD